MTSQARVGALERWPLDRLRPCPDNPRTHPPEQIEKLMASIRAFGWLNPVLADPTGEIIAGEARWLAGVRLGLEDCPVVILQGLSPLEQAAYRLADNRIAEDAGWDEDKLQSVIRELDASAEVDLAALGWTAAEIDALLAEAEAPKRRQRDPDEAPELPAEPVTQLGDIWELGPHRLVCGDSTDPATLQALLGQRMASMTVADVEQAELIFTDPPYGMSYKGKTHGGIKGDDARGDELRSLVGGALQQAVANARKGSAVYVCLTWRTYGEFVDALSAAGLQVNACIVWDKGRIGPGAMHYRPQHEFMFYCRGERWFGGRGEGDVWLFPRDNARDYVHPTQKPVALIERAIENSSRRGDVVLDVFAGSGSTLIACERLQRLARLVELDPRYCDAIVERWKRITGRSPVLRRLTMPETVSA